MLFENKGKWLTQISESMQQQESFYIDDPDDTSDLVDVVKPDGSRSWVSQATYDRHRAFFQNNLTKFMHKLNKNKSKQQDTEKEQKLKSMYKLAELRKGLLKDLKSSYGKDTDNFEKMLNDVESKLDKLSKELYGKTYKELKRR